MLEKNAIEVLGVGTKRIDGCLWTHLGQVAAVVVADDGVGDAQAADVALHRLEALRVDLVGEDRASVAHQRRHVRRLAAFHLTDNESVNRHTL